MEDVDERESLRRLEKKVRRLGVFSALLGLTLFASFVMPTYELRARRFVLTDEAGQQRGMWRVRNRAPALILQDTNGRWAAVIRVDETGPVLQLTQPASSASVVARATDGSAEVRLVGSPGQPSVQLDSGPSGASVGVLTEEGEILASVP